MKYSLRMCFPGGKRKAFTMSYDDGVEQDQRLIALMEANGVKGTFNINSGQFSAPGTVFPEGQIHRRMTQADCLSLYARPGVEVAVHALTHARLETLPLHAAVHQVITDRENLEALFGTIVRGMAYPFGTHSLTAVEALRACGIAYSRTVHSTHDFALPKNWLLLDPTCHHDDEQLDALTERFLTQQPKGDSWLFYLWGHAYEFEQRDNWPRIEAFLARIGGHEDVWYATNIEIYDYIRCYERLEVDVHGTRFFNPSAQDVYVLVDDTSLCIPAGTQVCL